MAVANTTNPPLVNSISYDSVEQEELPALLKRFDSEAQKLGIRGVTIVVSSGDDGVANFEARSDPSKCGFHPAFPSTSPSVLSVGATQGPEFGGGPEITCSSGTGGLITSGGGFSTVFPIPTYQSSALNDYFNNTQLPPENMWNKKGRGYPDVSMLGHNYFIIVGGQLYQVSGTSCSTPVTAGILSLINDARISAGKSSLGFVNPALYSLASSKGLFNDVTCGLNNCCAGQPPTTCCPYGFYAGIGWDATTGFGSLNFPVLLSLLG